MADEPINLVLEHLRVIRSQLTEHSARFNDVTDRLIRIELSTAGLRRDQAGDAENVAHLGVRLDRLSQDVERIKRRLDLID
jgi:predicted nuclease with TOPRIM domain